MRRLLSCLLTYCLPTSALFAQSFDVLFPTPKTRLLEMRTPQKFTAKLIEPTLKKDATSGQKSEQSPIYNAYSIDSDVTGDLVYVN